MNIVVASQLTDKQRFNGPAWIALVLSLSLLLFSTGQKAYRLTLPTDGWTPVIGFASDNPAATYNRVLDKDMFNLPTLLRSGDEVLAVAGQDVTGWEERGARGELSASPQWQVGQTMLYTIRRNGRIIEVEAPLRGWSAVALIKSALAGSRLPIYEILPGVLLACFVFWKRPGHLTAQLMLLEAAASLMMFISWLGSPGGFEEYFTSPLLGWVALFCSHLTPGFVLAPLGLAVVLSFPPRYSLLPRYPVRSAVLLVGLPVIAFIIMISNQFYKVILIIILLSTLFSIAWLLYMLVTVKEMPGRAQVRWLALAFGIGLLEMTVSVMVIFGLLPSAVGNGVEVIPLGLVINLALAIAILRYNLFDIDLILNRALVYGALTAAIIALYIFVVGYLGALFRTESNLLISLIATGLAAVLFQPLREWLQRGVNRLLYGERDEPVTVLSRLGQRLEATTAPEALLTGLVETISQALKLPYVAITLKQGDEFVTQATIGEPVTDTYRLPLVYQADAIGYLLVAPRAAGEAFNPADRLLLKNIAHQAGTVVQAVQLTADLQRSRQQLVTGREEERRRLRRDLHDGLGPQLASQMLTIEAMTKLLDDDPAKVRELLQHLKIQSQTAIQDIRRLVYNLRPPALDELGLVAALREGSKSIEQNGLSISLTVRPEPLPPLPAAIEVAIYRIVQEALTNVVHHAQATFCQVLITTDNQHLELMISDDGQGFPAQYQQGVGLNSMRERAEELGGRLSLTNVAPSGAEVRIRLPLPGGTL